MPHIYQILVFGGVRKVFTALSLMFMFLRGRKTKKNTDFKVSDHVYMQSKVELRQ